MTIFATSLVILTIVVTRANQRAIITWPDTISRCPGARFRLLAFQNFNSSQLKPTKMPMDFSTFIVQLNDAIINDNGPNLAYLLRPTSPHGKDLVKEFRNPTVRGFSFHTWMSTRVSMTRERRLADTKGACKAHGMTLLFNMYWCALMWRGRDISRHSRRSRSL